MKIFYSFVIIILLLSCNKTNPKLQQCELHFYPSFHDYCKVFINLNSDSSLMTLVRFKKFKNLNESLNGLMFPIDTFNIHDARVKDLYFFLANSNNFSKVNANEVILDGIDIEIINQYDNYSDTLSIVSPDKTKNADHFKYINLFFNIIENTTFPELQNYGQSLKKYFEYNQ